MSLSLFIGLLLSGFIGLSLGLIGGGGSIITVPVLVYVLGVEAHQAVSMSLAVVGATSIIGTSLHHQHKTVIWKIGALFGGAGILGAYFGSRLTYLFSPSALLLIFATIMIVVASVMFTNKHDESRNTRSELKTVKAILAGFGVGALTGFLGVGGGFLIVPALVLFGGLAMKEAIGTSLLVIAINCFAGLAGHLQHGGFDVRLTLMVTGLAILGALIGTNLSHRTSPASLKKWFAIFVFLVGIFLVVRNYHALI